MRLRALHTSVLFCACHIIIVLYQRNGNYKARASDLRREKRSDASLAWIVVSSWAWRRHCANDDAMLAQFFSHDGPQIFRPDLIHQLLVIHGIMLLSAAKLASIRD